jgi:hypothetical protein
MEVLSNQEDEETRPLNSDRGFLLCPTRQLLVRSNQAS